MNNFFQTITIMVLGLALGCQPDKPSEISGPKVPLPNAGGSVEFDKDSMVWLDGGSFEMGSDLMEMLSSWDVAGSSWSCTTCGVKSPP